MNNVGTAYVLWLGCLLQLHGLQRLYNGKIFTGLLWMFTLGLFGVGQLIDLFLIPSMVEEHNAKVRSQQGLLPPSMHQSLPAIEQVVSPDSVRIAQLEPHHLTMKLLQAASARGGRISVTHAVLDTGFGFAEVEAALRSLVKTGYVAVTNDPETGVVIYEFIELQA
jgi:hypothetical protein